MELKDTIKLMQSEDYKDRFKAEYWQTKIRADKLRTMLAKYVSYELDFKPNCDFHTLHNQWCYMNDYLEVLEERAGIEGVKLYD